MKKISIIIAVSLTLIASSCDPDNKDIFNAEGVKINGTFNKVTESITLGDTLKLSLKIPDTVTSNGRTTIVQSLQEAQFYLRISKLDTLNRRSSLVERSLYWASAGSLSSTSSFNYIFSKSAKPFNLLINFKPIEKGIYYFEVVSQPGELKINNSFEARLVVGFDVPDKHIYLAEPFAGADWANDARTREAGTYVFRVN